MIRTIQGLICSAGLSFLLIGCMDSDKKVDSEREVHNQFESVQDYTGEGYTLKNGKETDKIAEEHRKEVESAVKDFFLKEYKTDVKVHNAVGNEAGATVFVESTDPLHFYTYAVVKLRDAYNEEAFNPSDFEVVINLFMSDPGADPDEKVFHRVVHDIETMDDIPKGTYSIFVNDNSVLKQSFEGIKENSLERTTPDEIVKE
ncbi:DUF1672 family protein [Rossellomorea sp. LjRoot5]|uniref:DUF1672 family protein n=1 Tax=Rossellomorea sp. LjRoot5 TaxID=3342331 RepID=UPI003ECF304B